MWAFDCDDNGEVVDDHFYVRMFEHVSMLDADGDDCNDAFELEADIGQVGFGQCIMLLLKVVALVIEVETS